MPNACTLAGAVGHAAAAGAGDGLRQCGAVVQPRRGRRLPPAPAPGVSPTSLHACAQRLVINGAAVGVLMAHALALKSAGVQFHVRVGSLLSGILDGFACLALAMLS